MDRKYIDFNRIPFDNVSYPQRWLSSISALYGGIYIFTDNSAGEFPKYNAKEKKGAGSSRWGDYALCEYMENADVITSLKVEEEILSEKDINRIRNNLYKLAFTRFTSYFLNACRTNKEKAYELYKSVLAQDRFAKSSEFWRFAMIILDAKYSVEDKKFFMECNDRFYSEIRKEDFEKMRQGHTTFGVSKDEDSFRNNI